MELLCQCLFDLVACAGLIGLGFDLIGASLLAIASLPRVQERLSSNLEIGADTLTQNRQIERGDQGFENVLDVIRDHVVAEELPDYTGDKDADRPDDLLEDIYEIEYRQRLGTSDRGMQTVIKHANPSRGQQCQFDVGLPMTVMSWINREIQRAEYRIAVRYGIPFLIVGFLLQMISYAALNL
jgi:hypothetical protein